MSFDVLCSADHRSARHINLSVFVDKLQCKFNEDIFFNSIKELNYERLSGIELKF